MEQIMEVVMPAVLQLAGTVLSMALTVGVKGIKVINL